MCQELAFLTRLWNLPFHLSQNLHSKWILVISFCDTKLELALSIHDRKEILSNSQRQDRVTWNHDTIIVVTHKAVVLIWIFLEEQTDSLRGHILNNYSICLSCLTILMFREANLIIDDKVSQNRSSLCHDSVWIKVKLRFQTTHQANHLTNHWHTC